jgi:DNA polymerase-3 subunit gamma/tau
MCREITLGSSMDVLEIDGASNRGIDEVRDLREKIKYLPTQGKYRVYIIDEVHMLTDPAFNALLKTLEEPPAHAVFILATTAPHKVPVTILSRCQRYDFRRIPTALIHSHLAKLAEQEGWKIDPEGLALVARAAEGGLRDAQGFLDQVVTFGGDAVSAPEIARILGLTDRAALIAALKCIVQRQGPELLALIEALYNQGQDLRRLHQDLVLYARHLLLAALNPESRHLVEVADTEWEELLSLARLTSPSQLHNLLSVLLQGEEDLRRAPQPRLALEVQLLRLIHLEPLLPLTAWLARLETLEERLEKGPGRVREPQSPLAGGPQPAVSTPGPATPSTSGPPEADPLERWDAFLKYVQEQEGGPLYGKLADSRLVGVTDHRLQVAAGRSWNAVGARHQARLQELARAFFGPQYTLEIEVQAKRSGKGAATPKPLEEADLKQQALEIFGGQWRPVTPGKEEPE